MSDGPGKPIDSPKVLAARYRAAAQKARKRASVCGRRNASNARKGFLGVAESYDTLAKITDGMNKGPVEPSDRQA
jgi:hypothetical protein